MKVEERYATATCVMVVEDDKNLRDLFCKVIQKALGLQAIGAEDGFQAYDMLVVNSEIVDCVLCDVCIPKMDGLHLYEVMRRNRMLEAKKFVFITGKPDVEIDKLKQLCKVIVKRDMNDIPGLAKDLADGFGVEYKGLNR